MAATAMGIVIAVAVARAVAEPKSGCTTTMDDKTCQTSMLQRADRRGTVHGWEQDSGARDEQRRHAVTAPSVRVFYNIFKGKLEQLAVDIVKEQMAALSSASPDTFEVDFTTIGTPWSEGSIDGSGLGCSACYHRAHYDAGWEPVTHQAMYEYCVENPTKRVAYIHNKGSFHPSSYNDMIRRFLMRAITSEECVNMPDTCSVCSSRFSPLPHPHTPGNMWHAQCSHIQKLLPPASFEQKMNDLLAQGSTLDGKRHRDLWHVDFMEGGNRYAAEHWVHSHPDTQPCDIYDGKFRWGAIPDTDTPVWTGEWTPRLQRGIRFPLLSYSDANTVLDNDGCFVWVQWRCTEWRTLYKKLPADFNLWGFEEALQERTGHGLTWWEGSCIA